MNKSKPWNLGRTAMVGSLVVAHIWGSLLIVAVLRGTANSVIGDMFSSIGFMIFSILGVMVGGKAWKDFAPYMRGNETTTEEVHVTSTSTSPKPMEEQG